jgi:flagellar basal body-associated protein FliL
MKKYILILIGIIVTTILLTAEFYIGYEMGYQKHKDEANDRAREMIRNDEIPNYYMLVETLDFIINNKSGELQDKVISEK